MTDTTASDTIHTIETAATRASVEPRDIRRWIARGLPARLVGTKGKRGTSDYRIRDSALLAWMDGDQPEPAAAVATKKAPPRVAAGHGAAFDPADPFGLRAARGR